MVVSDSAVGLVVGPDIDLRIFFQHWAFGFAVFEDTAVGFKNSFQFFDRQGTAILKVFLTDQSNAKAFEGLVRDFTDAVQETELAIAPADPVTVYEDEKVDIAAFRKDWAALQDTYDFFPMLKKHAVSRLRAMHIAGEFTRQIPNTTITELLTQASKQEWQVMIFVANRGNIQIHTGPVTKIVPIPGWINVMDPIFNLHLRLDGIASTWVVRKPSADGDIHSVELYDEAGELILQCFRKRKPGIPETSTWTAFTQGLFQQ